VGVSAFASNSTYAKGPGLAYYIYSTAGIRRSTTNFVNGSSLSHHTRRGQSLSSTPSRRTDTPKENIFFLVEDSSSIFYFLFNLKN